MSGNRPILLLSASASLVLLILWLGKGMPIPGRVAAIPASEAAGVSVDIAPAAHAPETAEFAPAAESPSQGSGAALPDSVPAEPLPALYSSWTTYDDAVRQSRANGKPVLLDFNADWCSPCQALKHDVFENAAAGVTVQAAVVPVSVTDRISENGQNTPEVARLQQRFKVTAFPTLVVFSPATGRVLRSEGFTSTETTLRWITEAALAVR